MITYFTESIQENIQIKTIEVKSVSKKYSFPKTESRKINYNFQDFWALRDVSLDVYPGEVLGIIGRNGAGKTTLLNIIAGTLSPTQGEVFLRGKVLGLFNLGVGFQDELTGKENIFLNGAIIGATKKVLENKLSSIIEFSELGDFINMPLGTYSQGMRLRLAFSIVVELDFDILAIDEVLVVGDTLFQSKCFERLAGFKRVRKTMIITTQDLALIERFCDRVVVLNHGRLVFCGEAKEGLTAYRSLLGSEKFFVASSKNSQKLIETTKKWSEDMSEWGKELGTKEVTIESVRFMNRFGFICNKIKTGDYLRIKVHFNILNNINTPHFGIAIFRQDGVYCFGPNTVFDGYNIYELKPGKGWFALTFYKVLLAPGKYKISVAVWDKNETVAFNYQSGCYQLMIDGAHIKKKTLLDMPYGFKPRNLLDKINLPKALETVDYELLRKQWGTCIDSDQINLESIRLFDANDEETDTFFTNLPATIKINFSHALVSDIEFYLWVGIYRDDGIYCQGMYKKFGKCRDFSIRFRRLPLLPGRYEIFVGVWNNAEQKFIMYHGPFPLQMVFNRHHHGTIYLKHKWSWRMPK